MGTPPSYLELWAVHLTLQLVRHLVKGKVVRIECDNTIAVAHLNHQGGTHSRLLNEETCLL